MLGFVRQHRGPGNIADGIDAGNVGASQAVGPHQATIGFDAELFQSQMFGAADHTDSGNQPIGAELFLTSVLGRDNCFNAVLGMPHRT